MFQDFAKKKFEDYLALLEFPAGRISFSQLRSSTLPPFIISFFEYYVPKQNVPLDKRDFEEILNKAIIFNINYIIKPKNTILKFLFGDVETRPDHFIRARLKYFQFYGYYITQVTDFININSLEVISSNQIEHLINDVNQKLYEEISAAGSDSQRMNLVKLLYYFFHDLGDNNPINIKIPRKILSVYFQDKGYNDIKKRVDEFFSDEIFIQEALELMNPRTKRSAAPKSSADESDKKVKDIISRAKSESKTKNDTKVQSNESQKNDSRVEKESKAEEVEKVEEDFKPQYTFIEKSAIDKPAEEKPLEEKPAEELKAEPDTLIKLISTTAANREVEKILLPEEEIPIEIMRVNVEDLREQEAKLPELEKTRLVIDEEIYSDDLMFASQFSDLTPPVQLTDRQIRENLINDLFCEPSYRKKIIKQIFRKKEESFTEEVNSILDKKTWDEAVAAIEDIFTRRKVNYFSDTAVKFVDIFDGHFAKKNKSIDGKRTFNDNEIKESGSKAV
jgi:hypothetical protein